MTPQRKRIFVVAALALGLVVAATVVLAWRHKAAQEAKVWAILDGHKALALSCQRALDRLDTVIKESERAAQAGDTAKADYLLGEAGRLAALVEQCPKTFWDSVLVQAVAAGIEDPGLIDEVFQKWKKENGLFQHSEKPVGSQPPVAK